MEKIRTAIVGAGGWGYQHARAFFEREDCQVIELCGTKGRILIEDNVRRYSFMPHHSDMAEVWTAGFFDDAWRSFSNDLDLYLNEMIPALREKKRPPVPAEEGLRALKVAYACIESFKSGRRIDI